MVPSNYIHPYSHKAMGHLYLCSYEGESMKKQPNLFLGEIDLFFSDVIAL